MIKQAIIPLAGLGTRLLPLTSVFAKELLPINGRPGIEYIIDECIDAGIKEIVFIISTKKLMIKKYFYSDQFYKNIIKTDWARPWGDVFLGGPLREYSAAPCLTCYNS